MSPFPPLPDDAVVFRLVTHTQHHFPPGAEKPLPAAFSLTDEDRADLPPRLSVWDIARATTAQALAIRARAAAGTGRTLGQTTAFALRVSDVISVRIGAELAPRLSVVHDPLPPQDGPGHDGHCGVVGLDGVAGEPNGKNIRKELRRQLVARCFRLQ